MMQPTAIATFLAIAISAGSSDKHFCTSPGIVATRSDIKKNQVSDFLSVVPTIWFLIANENLSTLSHFCITRWK